MLFVALYLNDFGDCSGVFRQVYHVSPAISGKLLGIAFVLQGPCSSAICTAIRHPDVVLVWGTTFILPQVLLLGHPRRDVRDTSRYPPLMRTQVSDPLVVSVTHWWIGQA